jgi:HPt (histidine-containing phosphotransfer) domain-containing protein
MKLEDILFDERLDAETLHGLYEDDYEHAEVVFQQFVKSAPLQMLEIDKNFTQSTIDSFREKIHKLKPVFSFVGLTSLSNQAAAIEERCKTGSSINEIESEYQDFKNNFSTSLPVVEEVLQKLKDEI